MRIAVLGSDESWYLSDLRRAAGSAHEVFAVPWRDVAASIGGDRVRVTAGAMALDEVDAVLIRSMPPGSLEQVVFRMDALAQLQRAGVRVINPPRAVETAIDKFLTTARLAAAGLRVPRTVTCQTVDDALAAFEQLGRDVVIKPLFGSEGRGITRLTDPALAERAFRLLVPLGSTIYLQEFVPHAGRDIRVLRIGPQMLAIARHNPLDWRTNVSLGAAAEPVVLDDHLRHLARVASDAVGAPLAGVDLLPGHDGQLYAIEVNAVPGWRALGKALQVDVARLVLEALVSGTLITSEAAG